MAEPNCLGFVNRSPFRAVFLVGCEDPFNSSTSAALSAGLVGRTAGARQLRGVGPATERQSVGAVEPPHARGQFERTASPALLGAVSGVVGGPDRRPAPTIASPMRHSIASPAICTFEFVSKGLSSMSMTSSFLRLFFQVRGPGLPPNERVGQVVPGA